ncbi:MAG: hypothetical protein WCF36_13500 [Candidatus Nanopelagicales bacterium]
MKSARCGHQARGGSWTNPITLTNQGWQLDTRREEAADLVDFGYVVVFLDLA